MSYIQEVNGFLWPFLCLKYFATPPRHQAALALLKGRIDGNLRVVNKRLTGRQFLISNKRTIADVSMTAYLYYPPEKFGFDIAKDYPAIGAWLDRMKALPGWK